MAAINKMKGAKMYFLVEDNEDLSNTVPGLKEAFNLIKAEYECREEAIERIGLQYTITPILMTEEEFENLPKN